MRVGLVGLFTRKIPGGAKFRRDLLRFPAGAADDSAKPEVGIVQNAPVAAVAQLGEVCSGSPQKMRLPKEN